MKHVLNETELIDLIANGDREAFAQLYKKYLNNIYRFIFCICNSRETSEEIVQELFVKIWVGRENLKNVASIKPYLYQSAKNLLLNHIKRSQVETKVFKLIDFNRRDAVNQADGELIYNEYYRMAQNAIELLPEKRKEIFKLRLNNDLSLDEISQQMQISKSVVKKQLYSGISFVRNYLQKHGEIGALLLCIPFLSR